MFHVEPSKTGKSYVVVGESGEVAVTRMDGKPRYYTSEHAAQTRADEMNAEHVTEVADAVSGSEYDTNNPADFVARYGGQEVKPLPQITTETELRMELGGDDQFSEVMRWATDGLAQVIAEADSRCQAQPIHRMRAVPAVGYIEIDGKRFKACQQCIDAASPKLGKLH
jgi:hypothetical protein